MELLIRVHRSGHDPADLRVDVGDDQTVERLSAGLAEHLDETGTGSPRLLLARTGHILDPELPVGEAGLVSGDEVLLGPAGPIPPPMPTPVRGVSLDVLAGPDSGQSVVLDRSTYRLGRGSECHIVFGDPTVSRDHLHVEVAADWTVTISPVADTENGVLVNNARIDDATVVDGDDVVTLGSTRVAFREFIRAPDGSIDRLGQIEFHRTPYRPQPINPRELDSFGPIPVRPDRRPFAYLALLAPIAMGVFLFWIRQDIRFMAFILLSPMMMVGSWLQDRRNGRERFTTSVERFRRRIEERKVEIADALEAERVERVRAAPDLAELARRAELQTIDLWCRGRQAPDFLSLRLGLGTTSSLVSAPVDSGGEDELREEAIEAVAGHDTIAEVPITVDLARVGVLAVHGTPDEVDDVAASLAVQVACLHSPEDLIVAGAVSPERRLADWLKWLPHTRAVTSPLSGNHLTTTQDGARSLLATLVETAELRASETDRRQDRRWPWLCVLLDGDLDPDPTLVSQLLDRAPEAGLSVLWLSSSEARVPHQASAILDCQVSRGSTGARLWSTDPEVPMRQVELGRVHPDVADRVARSLAPVRDASVATATTAIPRAVPLLTALGTEEPDAHWVTTRWNTSRPYGLEHPVGIGADGIFSLDLVADGPHALIGGTSGAGKSELLQSMVASLVTLYPPTRLNFLFVDYKGGASSTVFRPLPHTVGYVTNLDASLAMRALTSLRAELNRRMQLLEGKAKDLEEMLARHRDDAPPSLVIVVDEFATLVKEIPDFVAGMVDIAQRGRSLGIHLILATQRPSGSVNDNILANTNLRLSLRMLDSAESTAIISSPEAAEIPVPLRGRGYARLGPRELVPFQSAYANAPVRAAQGPRPVLVTPFTIEPLSGSASTAQRSTDPAPDDDVPTQLDAVIDAVVDATAGAHYPPARAPWREMLPDHLTLDELRRHDRGTATPAGAGRHLPIGLVDVPEHQDQYPLTVDLEEGGGLLVFGSGGSGKTTVLRTVALSAALDAEPDDLVIFGLDFASRALRSIEALPHTALVGAGDDLEAATRVIALLSDEVEARRRTLSQAEAETLSVYREQGGRLPRILLLVDGYPNLAAAFSGGSVGAALDQWVAALHRIILEGRQVGIHTVVTTDRRGGVPALVQSAISHRIVLRQADESGYADHGISLNVAKGLTLAPGRGLWQGEQLVQVACVSELGEGRAQAAAIAERAAASPHADAGAAIRTAPLPHEVVLDGTHHLTGHGPLAGTIGLTDLTLDAAVVDLSYSNMLISGLPRSGRTTAAAQVAVALQQSGAELWCVGTSRSAGSELAGFSKSAFGRPDVLAPVLEELAVIVESLPGDTRRVLVVDDLDSLEDPSLNMLWDRLSKADALRIVATIESRSMSGFSQNALLNEVRKARRALYLQPDDLMEFYQSTGIRAPLRPGTPMPPGRGVLVIDRVPSIVQVANPSGVAPVEPTERAS